MVTSRRGRSLAPDVEVESGSLELSGARAADAGAPVASLSPDWAPTTAEPARPGQWSGGAPMGPDGGVFHGGPRVAPAA